MATRTQDGGYKATSAFWRCTGCARHLKEDNTPMQNYLLPGARLRINASFVGIYLALGQSEGGIPLGIPYSGLAGET